MLINKKVEPEVHFDPMHESWIHQTKTQDLLRNLELNSIIRLKTLSAIHGELNEMELRIQLAKIAEALNLVEKIKQNKIT